MTSTTSQYAAVGDFAETIGALLLIDKKNQATRTRRAVVLAARLVVLGGAALTGRASKGSGYAHGDAFAARAL